MSADGARSSEAPLTDALSAPRLPAVRTLLVLALGVATAAVLAPRASSPAGSPAVPGAQVPVSLAAQMAVSRALGGDLPAFHVRHGLRVENPAQGLRARFAVRGVTVRAAGVTAALSLLAVGRGASVRGMSPVRPSAHANRVSYRRDGLVEWYANGPFGLEQGFTMARRPAGTGTVSLQLLLSGTVRPQLTAPGALVLRGRGGRRVLYTGLSAFDARGRPLPAGFALRGRRVTIRVDDTGAVYPLRVDPVIATLTPTDAAAHMGVSLAASGRILVAGAAGGAVSAAYVFVEPVTGWQDAHQAAKLTPSVNSAGFGEQVAVVQPASGPSTVVVGAQSFDNGVDVTGAAYVFVEPGGGWAGTHTETAKLLASNGLDGDLFGSAVAVGATTAGLTTVAVGARGVNSFRGAVYVFVEPGSGWTAAPSETAELLDPSGVASDGLGGSMAVPDDGATVVAGAPTANANQGQVDVFGRPGGGWGGGTPALARLTPSDGGGRFAAALGATPSTIVAGAPDGHAGHGGLYVFVKPGGGWQTAHETAQLTGSDNPPSLGRWVAVAPQATCEGVLALPSQQPGVQLPVYDFVPPAAGWASTADAPSLALSFGTPYSLAASATTGFAGNIEDSSMTGAVSAFSLRGCTATTTSTGTTPTTTTSSTPATTATTPTTTPTATTPAGPQPESPAATLVLHCTQAKLALLDVVIDGHHVSLTGVAIAALEGLPVQIVFEHKTVVAHTTVGKDGFFSVTAPLPPPKERNSNDARYLAQVGPIKSLDLKLTRRLILEPPVASGRRVRLSGQVTPPLMRPVAPVSIAEQTTCTHKRIIGHFKPSATGHFRVTVTAPKGATAVIYRLATQVRANATSTKPFPTFSLPEVAHIG